jgi:hypothetical protein
MSSGPQIPSAAPRANAGLWSDSESKSERDSAPAIDCEADSAGVSFAHSFRMPLALTRPLVALANLRTCFE